MSLKNPQKGPMGNFQYVYIGNERKHYTAQSKPQLAGPQVPGPNQEQQSRLEAGNVVGGEKGKTSIG